jgi:hypothetical protein
MDHISRLTVKLVDDATAPAKRIAQALQEAEARAKALANSGASSRLQQRLSALGASSREIDKVSRAWKDYAAAEKLAADASQWTRIQASQVRAWENSVVASLRAVRTEERKLLQEQERMAAQAARRAARTPHGLFGMPGAAGLVGLWAAHKAQHSARTVLETYRAFDNERRFQKAVMGISDAEQEPLIQQAIRGGATTKYNDIQFLEAQRELAARGLKRDQILGLMDSAANFGMALDLTLPDAVRQMEGAIFGFQRDLSTRASALEAAKRTAGMQVKAAKISGMKPEDLLQLYKFGATPSFMAGLSEESLLAFGGVLKKANIGGDESGVAFRQMVAAAVSPSRKAKEALLAAGLNFADYQKAPDRLNTDKFVENIAAQYGVAIRGEARAGIDRIFSNKEMISDPAKFTPAVMAMLRKTLGGNDAKSLRSIAGAANRFRDASMGGIDVDRFIVDMMESLSQGDSSRAIQLANAVFGPKQGARIVTALRNSKTFKQYRNEISDSYGYDEKIKDERMAGFNGAVSRLTGSLMNLDTKIGRVWDDQGRGGFLTLATGATADFVQRLAEANPKLVQLGSAAAGIAALWLSAESIGLLKGGFGLKGSAVALDVSAARLSAAAGAITAAAGGKSVVGMTGAALMGGSSVAGIAATRFRGGAISASIALLEMMDKDAKGDNSIRSWLREALGIDDDKEPAPWRPGGAWSKDKGKQSSTWNDSVIKPNIDTQQFDDALRKLNAIKQSLQDIGNTSVSPSVTPQYAPAPASRPGGIGRAGLEDSLRGSFSDYGIDRYG